MPNLILNKDIVPELVQEKATVDNIFEKAYSFLVNSDAVKKIKDGYREVVSRMGLPGASRRAAEAIFLELKGKI